MMTAEQKLLFDEALAVRSNAYAPYSNFQVGASLLTSEGNIYSACNVENASYGLTVCAERNAIAQMIAAGERKIQAVLIIGGNNQLCPPCGACLQTIREFAETVIPVIVCNPEGQFEAKTLAAFLPFCFGSADLTPT